MQMHASPSPLSALSRLLPGVLVVAALLLLFRDTAAAMVGIWIRSETFTHAFLVPPISAWLIWRRRAVLAQMPPRPAPWFLLPMALACVLWLLGELAGVGPAAQFALVSLIVLSVPALFGLEIAKAIAFPLLFLFFSVPVGEFLVPAMMSGTADFTVMALRASGIPVYREGLQFVIPSGNWSVVEACSGVRYLIASFMVGTLFAYLNYRSTKRRLVFVVVSIVVPVIANWLRAYMIVMLGHLSGNQLAVGADHLVYGWVFFGIVIVLMFMIGARWFEPGDDDVARPRDAAPAAVPAGRTWAVVVGALLLVGGTHAALWQLDHHGERPAPRLTLPRTLDGGWVAIDGAITNWVPDFHNASAIAETVYRQGDDSVGVWIGYYRDQNQQRKLVSSTNVLVDQKSTRWASLSDGGSSLTTSAGAQPVRAAVLRQPPDPRAAPLQRLAVVQIYWVGGHFEASEARAKIRLAFQRLLGRGDDGAVLIFYTAVTEDTVADHAARRFAAQQLERLGAWLQQAAAASASP